MKRYDPDRAPVAEEWLAQDEQYRIMLVEQHHRHARIKLAKLTVHAALHVIVENQIAMKHEPVVRAMTRAAEGLCRHDAVHAVATVLTEHIHDLYHAEVSAADSQAVYNAAIERLSARSWREG